MFSVERCLEDHEVVLEVQATWSLKGDTRFVFCKNYAKYEFFRKPMVRCSPSVQIWVNREQLVLAVSTRVTYLISRSERQAFMNFLFLQLFFPECMISDSADVGKGMTSSELIQVTL